MDCYPPLASFIAHLNTMRGNPRGGVFQASSSSIPLRPVSEMCGTFRNKVLPSSSGMQQRAMAKAYKVFELSWVPGKYLKGGFPCLTLGFCQVVYDSSREHYHVMQFN